MGETVPSMSSQASYFLVLRVARESKFRDCYFGGAFARPTRDAGGAAGCPTFHGLKSGWMRLRCIVPKAEGGGFL